MDHCGGPRIRECSEQIRVISPPDLGTENNSSGMSFIPSRTKRTLLPSGEKDGPQSSERGGGAVSLRTVESSRESSAMPLAVLKTIDLPSGAHASSPRFGLTPCVSNCFSTP